MSAQLSKDAAAWLFAGLLCCLVPVAAYADSGAPVPVHVGNHSGYGRVVFNLPERLDYSLTQQGQHIAIASQATTPRFSLLSRAAHSADR